MVSPMTETLNGIVGTPEQQSALLTAIAKAQCAMEGARRDKVNPHLKNKYATLESVIEAVKPALKESGLSFQQMPNYVLATGDRPAYVEVTTTVAHAMGGIWAFVTELPVKPNPNAKEVGSSFTYAKRYALQSFWGIPSEDDDGNDASGTKAKAAKAEPADPMPAWRKAVESAANADRLTAMTESLKTRDNLTDAQKAEVRGLIDKKTKELSKGK